MFKEWNFAGIRTVLIITALCQLFVIFDVVKWNYSQTKSWSVWNAKSMTSAGRSMQFSSYYKNEMKQKCTRVWIMLLDSFKITQNFFLQNTTHSNCLFIQTEHVILNYINLSPQTKTSHQLCRLIITCLLVYMWMESQAETSQIFTSTKWVNVRLSVSVSGSLCIYGFVWRVFILIRYASCAACRCGWHTFMLMMCTVHLPVIWFNWQ